MVSSEGLLWYIFPVERLIGLFRVELFFPAKKAQDDRREVVAAVRLTTSQRSFPAIWRETIHRQKNFPPPKTQPFN